MNGPLKVLIELDLSRDEDRQLMELVTKFKAAQAQGLPISLPSIVHQVSNEKPKFPSSMAKMQASKEASEQAHELAKKIGDESGKLSYKERAKVAADARWAKWRAAKEGLPEPTKPAKQKIKKVKASKLDFSKAEEDGGEFATEDAEEFNLAFNGTRFKSKSQVEPIVDARDIMEENYEDPEEEEDEIQDDETSDDDDVRRINERAAAHRED